MPLTVVTDASDSPDLPDSDELESPPASLTFATPARNRLVRLDGGHATVLAHERSGITGIRFADVRTGPLRLDVGAPANCVITPRHLTRELVGPAGSSIERTFVPTTLPLVAYQWRHGVDGARAAASLLLGAEHPWSQADVGDGWARVTASDGAVLTVGFAGGAGRIEVTDRQGANLLVFEPGDVSAPTLFLGGGEAGRTLRGAAHIASHLLNAARGEREGFQLRTGVEELDDGFAWARLRLRGEVARQHREGRGLRADPQALLSAVATLATADVEGARSALFGGLVASDHAWAEERFIRVFNRETPSVRALPDPEAPAAKARSLPVAGRAVVPTRSEWIEALGAGSPEFPLPNGLTEGEAELFGLVATMRTDPDQGWAMWRALMSQGMGDFAGLGLWDYPDPDGLSAAWTASALAGISIGLLGLAHDAEVDRLRLAPAFPSSIKSFAVDGIEMGGSSTDLVYARDDRTHTFELIPRHGRVPVTVVFEPSVAGAVERVLLDGAPTELDLRSADGRTTVPLQMRLEGPRTLEIVGA